MPRRASLLLLARSDERERRVVAVLDGTDWPLWPEPSRTLDGLLRTLATEAPATLLLDDALLDAGEGAPHALVRQLAERCPLVILSDARDPERVADLLHAGAVDYVLWDNLSRLVPALRRVEQGASGCRDLAALRRAEQARDRLQAEGERQRELLAQLVATAPFGIAVLRVPGLVHDLTNPYYERVPRSVPGPALGRSFSEVFPELAEQGILAIIEDAAATGEVTSIRERDLLLASSSVRTYWDADHVPLRDFDGGVSRVLVVVREVTEIHRARLALQESERQYTALFTASLDGLVLISADGLVLDANPSACALLGVECDELVQHPVHPWMSRVGVPTWSRLLQRGQFRRGASLQRPDGTRVDLVVIGLASVLPGRHMLVLHDVTERKRAERRLRQRLNEVSTLLAASQALLGGLNREEVLQRVCDIAVKSFDLSLAWVGLLEDERQVIAPVAQASRRGPTVRPKAVPAVQRGADLHPAARALRGRAAIAERVSARPGASPWRLELAGWGYRSMGAFPLAIDGEALGVLVVCHERETGLIGQTQALQSLANLAAEGLHKAALYEHVDHYAAFLEERVSERTEALRASEAHFRAVFEGAAAGIALLDAEGRIVDGNPAFVRMLGCPPDAVVSRPFAEVLGLAPSDAEELDTHRQALLDREQDIARMDLPFRPHYGVTGGGAQAGEAPAVPGAAPAAAEWRRGRLLISRGGGAVRLETLRSDRAGPAPQATLGAGASGILVRQRPGHYTIAMLEDVTEVREMEQALVRASQFTRLGELAANLAHEIKNPLQGLVGCMGLARELVAAGEDPTRYLDVAGSELRRTAQLVERFRDLHRPFEPGHRAPTDLSEIAREVLVLNEDRARRRQVRLTLTPAPALPDVVASREGLQQVLLNLVMNAIDATAPGGEVSIALRATQAPNGVAADVADDGTGIAPEDLQHLFMPFHSTKPGGSGQGLYISQQIMAQHGGYIDVHSVLGAGSTFTIWLPTGR